MNQQVAFPNPYWVLNHSEDRQLEFVIVLVSVNDTVVNLTQMHLAEEKIAIDAIRALGENKITEIIISSTTQLAWKVFKQLLFLLEQEGGDIFLLPVTSRKKQLLICDMDSTIVQTETLDDIAATIGLGDKVSEITAKAMRGELDFRKALDERVSLLSGLSEQLFAEIAEDVQFNHGAEVLLKTAKAHGIRSVLVSGGFEPIVKVVAVKLGFDRYVCNKTEISNGKLTGKVEAPIVDAETKLKVLNEECVQLDISPEQVCAMGDGANDLPMLQAAGLGIGFKGKPLVRAGIPYQINSSSLDSALYMMGIT